ncbi:MAG: hypothetical protein ACJAYU_002846 [Bradymonadia bacterium]
MRRYFNTPGDYDLAGVLEVYDITTELGVDEFDCTFPPPGFHCPDGTFPEGVYEVAVAANSESTTCVDADLGEHLFTTVGDIISRDIVLDDHEMPFQEAEASCDDGIDNDLDGCFDGDDADSLAACT